MRLEDARDRLRVCHGAARGRLRGPADRAADRLGPRRRDRPSGEGRVEGVGQVMPRGGRAMDADGVLVVDPAPIDDGPRPVQDEHLGRPLGAEAVGQAVAHVLEDRERQAVFVSESADRNRPVLPVGVDAEEADASLLEIACDLRQPRGIGVGQGALGPEEGQHDDFLITCLAERVPGSPVILKSEVDRRLRRFARPDQADHAAMTPTNPVAPIVRPPVFPTRYPEPPAIISQMSDGLYGSGSGVMTRPWPGSRAHSGAAAGRCRTGWFPDRSQFSTNHYS